MPKRVAAHIPKHVQTPIALLDCEPAPVANTSGNVPITKLHAVIITGRRTNRVRLDYHSRLPQ